MSNLKEDSLGSNKFHYDLIFNYNRNKSKDSDKRSKFNLIDAIELEKIYK
jgi:hypothetical protein